MRASLGMVGVAALAVAFSFGACNCPPPNPDPDAGPDGGGSNQCLNTGQGCTVGGNACCAGLTCVNPATYLTCDGTTSCACEVVLN